VTAGHVRGGPGFVNKDEAFGFEIDLAIKPMPALPQDVGTVLLDRVAGLYGMARPFSSASDMMPVLEKEGADRGLL
jgi:hypothetical protein